MSEKPENPNAFPMPGLSGLPNDQFMHGDHGMSLRDYFAAAAFPALVNLAIESCKQGSLKGDIDERALAEKCYAMADAMLAERAKA